MKETGIVRQVDELGRIVLPIELRRTLHIKNKEELVFSIEDDVIILRKKRTTCRLCNNAWNLKDFQGEKVCDSCLRELRQMDMD